MAKQQDSTVRIASYNVNGIRAAERKGFSDWLRETAPDIVCLQETKAQPGQMPDVYEELGYEVSWHSARKKGYSGVGILSKMKPERTEAGIGVDWIDEEGRFLCHEYAGFKVVSLYLPSGTTGSTRQELKMESLEAMRAFGRRQLSDGKPVVLCGDYNIAHTALDVHAPKRLKNTSGFLPEERAWFSEFLSLGYEDVFRAQHPGQAELYSWWSYRAASKERNKGWRLDYHLAGNGMAGLAVHATIEKERNMSDHAPITVEYRLDA